MAIPVLLAITLHEVAHGRAALFFGDTTAKAQGRLSLNPLKHIDLVGTVLMPVLLLVVHSPFLFGWAKPVPVDFRRLRHPKADMAWVAAAGPTANVAMAFGWTLVLKLAASGLLGAGDVRDWLGGMAQVGIAFNVVLAVFNMIPVPPLDGGRVLVGVLPMTPARAVARLEPYGLWIVIGLLMLNSRLHVLDALIGPPANALMSLIERFLS